MQRLKKIAITVLALVLFFCAEAQPPQPAGFPLTKSKGWIEYGYVQSDSGTIAALRDTLWNPRFPGTYVYWRNAGVDTSFWVFNGKTSGKKWDKVGGANQVVPAQFNPIAGTNMSLTGTYPNITFNASGSGGNDSAYVRGVMINDSTLRLYRDNDDSSTFVIKGGAFLYKSDTATMLSGYWNKRDTIFITQLPLKFNYNSGTNQYELFMPQASATDSGWISNIDFVNFDSAFVRGTVVNDSTLTLFRLNGTSQTFTIRGGVNTGGGGSQTPWLQDINANHYDLDSLQKIQIQTRTGTIGSNTYATWNPLDKAAGITLSGGDLTSQGSGGALEMVRNTILKSSGKWYWEELIDVDGNHKVGISDGSESLESTLGDGAGSYGYQADGQKKNNGTASAYGATYTAGDVIGTALDLDAGTIEYFKNGASQGVAFTGISGTFFAAHSYGFSSASATANFGASAFAHSVPSGFNSGWYTAGSGDYVYRTAYRTNDSAQNFLGKDSVSNYAINLNGSIGVNPDSVLLNATIGDTALKINNSTKRLERFITSNLANNNQALTANRTVSGSFSLTFSNTSNIFSNDITVNGLTAGRGGNAVSTNSAFGVSALTANLSSGTENSAFGYNSGLNVTSADGVSLFGSNAGRNTTTGGGATAFGNNSAYTNVDGFFNTSVGFESLYSNSTSWTNTAVGSAALYQTTGGGNVGIGAGSGWGITSGERNINIYARSTPNSVSFPTASGVTTGNGNVIIGGLPGGGLGLAGSTTNHVILLDGDGNQKIRFNENGAMTTYGSVSYALRTITSTTTLADTDYTALCSTNTFTVNLPTAVGINGRVYVIKNITSGTTITVDGSGGETIDGAPTYSLASQYKLVMIQSDGTNWNIISNN